VLTCDVIIMVLLSADGLYPSVSAISICPWNEELISRLSEAPFQEALKR
jgi:hypothetical protein